jgi:IS30 family transposase
MKVRVRMIARMMSRFPSTVTRYMVRKNPKRMDCKSGSSESPRRRNSMIPVWFPETKLFRRLMIKYK